MPFTLAHPAAVLPLARSPLPLSALVAGSLVPDVPLFVSVGIDYATTHTPLGILTIDLLLGLAVWAAWVLVVREPLRDGLPAVARRRWPRPVGPRRRDLVLAGPAVVVGAATHVVWDEFTHAGRWGATHVPWLAQTHGPFTGTSWAQYASGLGGLAVVALVLLHAARRAPLRPVPRRLAWAPWVVRAPILAGGVAVGVAAASAPGGLRGALFLAVTRGILAGALALLAGSLAWHAADRTVARSAA